MKGGGEIGGCREPDSLYGNEIETNNEEISGACTNTMDINTNSEPGHGGADKNVDSKKQAGCASDIRLTIRESIKVVQDKIGKISTGHWIPHS